MQQVLCQPLRTGLIGQVSIENGFHQRIAACNDIARHKQVWFQFDLISIIAFDQSDLLITKLCTHRWINIDIAASNGMTGSTCQYGQTAHESAANAENMDMHKCPVDD